MSPSSPNTLVTRLGPVLTPASPKERAEIPKVAADGLVSVQLLEAVDRCAMILGVMEDLEVRLQV
jgi:hypothetical protein